MADMRHVRLHTLDSGRHPALQPLLGASLQPQRVRAHWNDILRLATSIKQGTLSVAPALRKLGGQQHGLGAALRELGRIERTLFILDWLHDPALRGRVQAELHKSEARDALARALFRGHAGSLREHDFEHQRYRASALNLVTDAVVLWNTVHLKRAARDAGHAPGDILLQSLAPLSCKHVDLGGSYAWGQRH
ncbi:Tn3 family transposase [Pseudoduganella sp. LjRoot289]|uniref:Tn3 family transposase n=1 Tax=Pseudoduganella sp. LjRoot289 TaxID=3342314 RepID=UPI003F4F7292